MLSLAAHGGNDLHDGIHNACDRPLSKKELESNAHRVDALVILKGLPYGQQSRSQRDNDQRQEPIGMTQDQLAKRERPLSAINVDKQMVKLGDQERGTNRVITAHQCQD